MDVYAITRSSRAVQYPRHIQRSIMYGKSGVFEDFYIQPEYRHQGIAQKLVSYAYEQSGVSSLTVGCADCDVQMYQAIGFKISLGNMLAFGG